VLASVDIVYGPAGIHPDRASVTVPAVNLYSIFRHFGLTSSVAFIPIVYLVLLECVRNRRPSLETRRGPARPAREGDLDVILAAPPAIMYKRLTGAHRVAGELSIRCCTASGPDRVVRQLPYGLRLDRAKPDYGVLGAAAILFPAFLACW